MVKRDDWAHAQASVIGSALIDPRCVPLILSACAPSDLSGEYSTLLAAIRDLAIRGQPVDPVTVLATVGPAYEQLIRRLMDETPTAANVTAYIDICKEQSRLAALSALGADLLAAENLEDARGILQRAQAVTVERDASRITDMSTALARFYDRHQQGAHEYVSVGMPALDERLALDFGDVLVLGGYPSDGKTALALQWCWQMAASYKVGIFSFETSEAKLTDRAVAQAMRVDFSAIKRSKLDGPAWQTITAGSVNFTRRGMEIIEAAGMTPEDVLGVTLSRGYQVIALDYVQLVTPSTVRRGGTRAEEVAEISKALALMARRHRLLVIELSQLSRPQKNAKGKTPAPTLSSLRESGQLEQDADVVALLYRLGEADDANRELYIAKNKEGRLGRLELAFNGAQQRFLHVARGEDIPRELAAAQRKRQEAKKSGGEQTELPM